MNILVMSVGILNVLWVYFKCILSIVESKSSFWGFSNPFCCKIEVNIQSLLIVVCVKSILFSAWTIKKVLNIAAAKLWIPRDIMLLHFNFPPVIYGGKLLEKSRKFIFQTFSSGGGRNIYPENNSIQWWIFHLLNTLMYY